MGGVKGQENLTSPFLGWEGGLQLSRLNTTGSTVTTFTEKSASRNQSEIFSLYTFFAV